MADEISKTGLWISDKTGKVVTKQPEGGSTLIAIEGDPVTPAVQARIDALDADPNAKPLSAAEALGYETASAPADVETAADTTKAKRARKSSK